MKLRLLLEVPDYDVRGETAEGCAFNLLSAHGEYSASAEVIEAEWVED